MCRGAFHGFSAALPEEEKKKNKKRKEAWTTRGQTMDPPAQCVEPPAQGVEPPAQGVDRAFPKLAPKLSSSISHLMSVSTVSTHVHSLGGRFNSLGGWFHCSSMVCPLSTLVFRIRLILACAQMLALGMVAVLVGHRHPKRYDDRPETVRRTTHTCRKDKGAGSVK